MGCASSQEAQMTPEQKEAARVEKEKSKKLEETLEQDHDDQKLVIKLLLLGAGESGKSTLFKQMITLYGTGFSEYDRRNTYLRIIQSNALNAIKILCYYCPGFGPVQQHLEPSRQLIDELKGDEELVPALAAHIAALWADPGIQQTYANRHKFQISDSAAYFLNKVNDISREGYIPTEQDVIRARVRTTGIISNEFIIDDNKFQMFDVGGQRNERKKWIHCFEGVTAVIFVAAMSEYDQVLYEDDSQNRVVEALQLFDEICNSRWFKRTSMVLFLNKCDLFAEKIQRVPLTTCFPEYQGDQSFDQCCAFLRQQFEKRNRTFIKGELKKMYTHVTCATDKDNVNAVFNVCKDIIIRASLDNAGL